MHLHLGCLDKTGKSTLCIAMYGRAAFSQWNELNPKGHGSNTFLTLDLKPKNHVHFPGLLLTGVQVWPVHASAQPALRFQGLWHEAVIHGCGRYTWPDGRTLLGSTRQPMS